MNMKQMEFKQPLYKHNRFIVLEKLKESCTYFSQLRKTKDDQLLILSKNKLAAIGFIICIKSLTVLYDDLIISQDLLSSIYH